MSQRNWKNKLLIKDYSKVKKIENKNGGNLNHTQAWQLHFSGISMNKDISFP